MNKPLTGQTALISGGLGDIGRAVALALAQRGAAVAVCDVRPAADAEPLLAALRDLDVPARYDPVDVADAGAVEAWVADIGQTLGLPTLVVPNAAIVTKASVLELSVEAWSRELSINLTGGFVLAQAAAKRMVAAKRGGRIVFIGSWAGHRPHQHLTAYCVTKAGLRMLMRQLALELAEHDILVNEVAPGYVDAGLSGRLFDQNPPLRDQARARVPIHRLIEPADVALEVAHLCDPAVRHHTGAVSLMDGGLSLE